MKKVFILLLLLNLLIPYRTQSLNLYKGTPYKYDGITDEEVYQYDKRK